MNRPQTYLIYGLGMKPLSITGRLEIKYDGMVDIKDEKGESLIIGKLSIITVVKDLSTEG